MGTLLNGVKELYQSTLSTGSYFPVCDTNGSPTGHISADKLASVLGGVVKSYAENIDLNSITSIGRYFFNWRDGITNIPSGLATSFHMIVENPVSSRLIQTIVNASNGAIYSRIRKSAGDWTAWQQVYDTSLLNNQALLNPLVSALGLRSGLYPMGEITGTSDDPVTIIQEVVAATPNISQSTIFCGTHLYVSRVMFIGYTYANKQTGLFQVWKYDGTVKTVQIQNGVYTEVV